MKWNNTIRAVTKVSFRFVFLIWLSFSLGDFLCIRTPNTGQLNPPFHTFTEFRLIVNRIVVRQSTDWLAANAQFSPNVRVIDIVKFLLR